MTTQYWDQIISIKQFLASAVRSNMGASITGTNNWFDVAAGSDGKLYCAPFNATDILIIDPIAGTATRLTLGASLSGSQKWVGIAAGADGNLYCAPFDATDILIIDPIAGTATRSTLGASLTGTAKWAGIAAAADGNLYCAPWDATDILIISPGAGTAARSTMGASLTGTFKWYGIAAGSDGKLYCAPRNATDILIIDPIAGTATRLTLGASLSGSQKWVDIAAGGDGKLYCAPQDATDILIINPGAGTATTSTMGASLTGTNKWDGITLASDGKMYCAPRSATDILIINPVAGTATRSTLGASLTDTNKYVGIAAGANGKLYCAPRDATDILNITPGPIPWTPEAITTSMWIDFSQSSTVSTTSGLINSVVDKKGNGITFTGTTTERPQYITAGINGLNVARFDGSNDRLLGDTASRALTNNVGAVSIYSVSNATSGGGGRGILTFSTGSAANSARTTLYKRDPSLNYQVVAAGRRLDGDTAQEVEVTPAVPSDIVITGALFDYTNAELYAIVNAVRTARGGFQTAGNTSATNSVAVYIGLLGTLSWFGGDIGEIIVTLNILSQDIEDKLIGYLAHKWGKTNELPSNHPYKTYRPIV